MKAVRLTILILALACSTEALGQPSGRDPKIGYVYPAGGRQQTTFRVVVGGQALRGVGEAHVTGTGVRASVIKHFPPMRNLDAEERAALFSRLRELLEERWAEAAKAGEVEQPLPPGPAAARGAGRNKAEQKRPSDGDRQQNSSRLPEHPLLYELEKKSLRELLHVLHELRNQQKAQRNSQIAESVLLEMTIDRDAAPGDRELRLQTALGLTNPVVFQVGGWREVSELETGDGPPARLLSPEPPLEPPVLLNGQIMPGDIDRFRFRARKGQRLVIETHARRLIPYLADAVPGWFQATLTLRDAAGRELAFVDDYRFCPDPVLFWAPPEDGEYELEIRDSLYRGREDFVYRIALGERPYVTSIFPLGCRAGQKRFVAVNGWNVSKGRLYLDPPGEEEVGILQKPLQRGSALSNVVPYEVSPLPARTETEPNDSPAEAQKVPLPRVIDGRIDRPGDMDLFRFQGRAGEEVVAEVTARRLHSPVDSLLRLLDADGAVLAWNDDHDHKDGFLHTAAGLLTHEADSYLRATLPRDGDYFIQITDAQSQGGEDHAYRLRIGPPQPDFEVRVTPSSLTLRGGFAAPLRLYALRKDGFNGPIEVTLKDPPAGLVLSGAIIPAGRDSVRATLSGFDTVEGPISLRLEGRAWIAAREVRRAVVPAEDVMQAFLYRHLAPSQELVVATVGGRRLGRQPLRSGLPNAVRIPLGGTARLRIPVAHNPRLSSLKFELDQPPPGVTLRQIASSREGLSIELTADRRKATPGVTDNLIVEAFLEVERGDDRKGGGQRKQRVSLGVLPAIACEIVPP